MAMQRLREQPMHCSNLAATVLKENGSSGPAIITRLWYDGCEMASNEKFEAGEKIKVIIRGMGGIDAHVASATEGWLSARFVEECPV
jgi:hypothetical protein